MRLYAILLAASAMILMGCGGGGGGSGVMAVPVPDGPDFADLLDDHDVLAAQQQSFDAYNVDTDTFSGTASFSGFVNYEEVVEAGGNASFGLAGTLDLEVAFSSTRNVVTGAITDISDTADNAYGGDITLNSGQIDPNNSAQNGYAMSSGLTGNLRDSRGNALSAQGGLDADFFGSGAQYVGGITFLTLDGDDDPVSLRGTIVAEAD